MEAHRAKPTEKARFRWLYPAFERLPLTLDKPPSAERFNDVLRAAGRAAKDSMKVEVPFEQVAPAEADYWKGDSGKELVVPIGRAGARRLQPVRLGQGDVAAFARRGQDGLRQVDVSARLHHERGADVQPGSGRVLSDRLQEGRRIQDVRDAPLAACAGDCDRKRARVWLERAGAARWRVAAARRVVSRGRRAGFARFSQGAAR